MLELKNLYKTFNPGTINEKLALNGLSLTLKEGDFVTVIGGNGAGKSTMLNAVAGTWMVDEGQILIDGTDVTRLSEHKRAAYLGRVFQDPMTGTAATMGIEENLALAKRRGKTRFLRPGITRKERDEYRELLKVLGLGLEGRLTSKVGLLSGGQRQALTLLMATLKKPKLLLLDEHTAALDPKTAAKVLEITDMIVNRDHLTTMMITHNMQDAINHGNRLIMMMEGKIILDIEGEEKKKLTVRNLLDQFEKASGQEFSNDSALLGLLKIVPAFHLKCRYFFTKIGIYDFLSHIPIFVLKPFYPVFLFNPSHGKADTLFLHINAQYTDVNHVTYADSFQRMLDILFADL